MNTPTLKLSLIVPPEPAALDGPSCADTNDTPQPASATRPDCAPPIGSAPFALSDDEAKLIRNAVRAVDDHEYSGICCEGRDGKTADALVGRGLMRYVGEAEVDDGDGWSTGDCGACYEATDQGRHALTMWETAANHAALCRGIDALPNTQGEPRSASAPTKG